MTSGFAPLKSFIERIERLDEEIAASNADKREVYAEAKGTGFDVKIMKLLISERRKEPADLAEQSELLDLYRRAVNGTVVATPAPARSAQRAAPIPNENTETAPTPPECRTGHTIASGSTESCGSVDGHAGHLEPGTAKRIGLGEPIETLEDEREISSDAGAYAAEAGSTAEGVETFPQDASAIDFPAAMETNRDAVIAEIAKPAVKHVAPRVVSDPEIHDGAPVVAGTSVQTSGIKQFADDGYDAEAIIEEYPSLTKLDVAAALAFEAQQQDRALAERPTKRAGEIRPPSKPVEMPEIPAFLRRTSDASPPITAATETAGRV